MKMRLQKWAVPLLALMLGFSCMHVKAQSDGNQKIVNLRTQDGHEYQFKFSKFEKIVCELHELKVLYRTGEVEDIVYQNYVSPTSKTMGYYEDVGYKMEKTEQVVVNVDEGVVITFGELSTGIGENPADQPLGKTRIEVQSANRLHVYGMRPTDRITVYAIDGRKMEAVVNVSGDEADISLADLPAGIYVVNVNESCTIKMQKR